MRTGAKLPFALRNMKYIQTLPPWLVLLHQLPKAQSQGNGIELSTRNYPLYNTLLRGSSRTSIPLDEYNEDSSWCVYPCLKREVVSKISLLK